ncbi:MULTISPECIES: hypothetical protein [Streptomyces]|uniref:Colicin D immunity protein domain-containing protein n=1 Tax=Streptomyces physcomitrii TaxID=2724184 RepID=A0ABX1GUV4_9ACTN|nr:hypothetical protein [Streptomyces physcomitrii]NKI39827.1 hypothetical protein [Streptomyces physcomitrii]
MSDSPNAQWLREGVRQSIQKYRAGGIALRVLIDDLDSVSSDLEGSPLGEDLRSHWWVLEEIYAVALDRGDLQGLPREDELAIEETLDALERLLS